ncbi:MULTISPECIES: protease pro-enzyme activation domain-containing protein [unclassified Bradyrhizobium]|uniref:S53 family peptidase n=1 Tax=unclassified Bradyrhizobium TaxID=2631580 RepID=UPI001BA91A40|nr:MULTISPECIES: S53 family peptidase [unclassified Bradyrhizobium]MBR1208622.1 S8/S53 family peptidase [Bradyrhizobium sp. AUGA SZCCT0124]MBR1314713.1 S8/S53 family peptidase [Bradyrhizobium sp. AUGA SZCCT0051]MBR1345365.1 S8/S53 family peptidase [Bradyrhizobium sp. AUGA SZCCT0105]MBR1359996.1 S8/S53 family peptidase [Bradyrhizobium sp. AUGA SZCCT0045]
MAGSRQRRVPLAGSNRAAPVGATLVGDVDPDERIPIVVYVKRRTPDKFPTGSAGDLARLAKPITRHQLATQRHRSHARAVARVVRLAAERGLTVGRSDPVARTVELEGTARQMAEIFGATLCTYRDGERTFRARVGGLTVPAEIAPWTRAILGFDQRPLRTRTPLVQARADMGSGSGLWPTDIAARYGIPLDRDVSSICVGIIALGGGYLASDLAMAVAGMNRPPPVVVNVPPSGNGGFGTNDVADQEIALDLQVLAGLLPKSKIVVYFAENSAAGLTDAIHQAVFDEEHAPQVVSVSWGSAEKYWTGPGRDAMQAVLADAARLRVSVLFASGDQLATSGLADGKVHVWFPASSPYATSCGGTQPVPAAGNGSAAAEAVWNAGAVGTGGGISDAFPVPDYQSHLTLPKSQNDGAIRRGVPDVACAAAASPGYRIIVNGQAMAMSGTSAATPLWAALVAIAVAARGEQIGFLNTALYSNPGAFRAVVQGNNRVGGKGYDAGPGWSACTGLGVPKGADLLAALTAIPVA